MITANTNPVKTIDETGELPAGWEWKRLSEVAKTTSGGTPSRNYPEYFLGDIPWIKSGELEDDYIFDSEEKITEEAFKKSSAKIFPRGTLLMAMYGATVGKLGILEVASATNQAICAILPKKKYENSLFNNRFLFYYLKSIRNKIINRSYGAAQPNISQALIKGIYIPIPFPDDPIHSFEIQSRIVARIEALIPETKEARNLLDQMRRDNNQVLEAALGQAIADLDEQYPDSPNIDELVSNKRIHIASGGTPSRSKEEYWIGSIPWVSPKDMKRWYINDAQEHISPIALQETTAVKPIPLGSVLTVVRGMILAHTLPVGVTKTEVTINQDMKALIPDDSLLPEYVGYILRARAPSVLQQVEMAAHGTRRLKTDTLKQIIVPNISKNAQRKIVEYFNCVQSDVDEMKTRLERDTTLLAQLEQSILEQAFVGKL